MSYSTSFQGFTETTLVPLQASPRLFRADQRRAPINPPLPPISHDQVPLCELVTLLTDEDYNLTTVEKVLFIIFALKITSLISSNLLSKILISTLYNLICHLVLHSHTGYYSSSYIFCAKYLSAFFQVISSSMLTILHYRAPYSSIHSQIGLLI